MPAWPCGHCSTRVKRGGNREAAVAQARRRPCWNGVKLHQRHFHPNVYMVVYEIVGPARPMKVCGVVSSSKFRDSPREQDRPSLRDIVTSAAVLPMYPGQLCSMFLPQPARRSVRHIRTVRIRTFASSVNGNDSGRGVGGTDHSGGRASAYATFCRNPGRPCESPRFHECGTPTIHHRATRTSLRPPAAAGTCPQATPAPSP